MSEASPLKDGTRGTQFYSPAPFLWQRRTLVWHWLIRENIIGFHHGRSIVHTIFMAFICKLVNVKMQCTHGMFFTLIGMKFHGKFLEANNLYFGKEPQNRGEKAQRWGFLGNWCSFLGVSFANEKKWWHAFIGCQSCPALKNAVGFEDI